MALYVCCCVGAEALHWRNGLLSAPGEEDASALSYR